jgi:hypothetical protein
MAYRAVEVNFQFSYLSLVYIDKCLSAWLNGLSLRKEPVVSIEQETGWPPDLIWPQ